MANDRPARWPGLLMALLTLGVVATVAGVGWRRLAATAPPPVRASGTAAPEPPAFAVTPPQRNEPPTAAAGPPPLKPGRDYYVWVKLAEVRPTKADGGRWETRKDAAPDLFFKLYWNNTLVYTSPARDDRLIAEWDLLRLDLKDAILSGQVDIASAVNAPIVHLNEDGGGKLRLEFFDEDTLTFNDEAGTLDLPVESLHEGAATFNPNPDAKGGLARVVLDLVPRDTSLPDLLQIASNR